MDTADTSVRATLLILFAVPALFAQEAQQGSLTGFVSDASRATMPNAEVVVTNKGTNLSRRARTSGAGLYTFVGLDPGAYTLHVAAAGFKTQERPEIQLDTGASVRVDFTMEIGAASETVTIAADAPILKTESGEVSTLVSGTQVTELALNGRNFTQFLALGTGVVSQQTGHQMGLGQEGNPLMSVNGGRISMNKFTFDGTLAMDTGGNRGVDVFPPMEAIGEISMQKSNYSADSGGFGSSVVNVVTKSGTQQFHGDVYEYFRNDALDTRNFFSNSRQIIRQNNFGYTLGGPFFIPGHYNTGKTKDFFFWSESWYRRVGPQIDSFTAPPVSVFNALVPTEAMKTGDFSALLPKTIIKDPSGNAYPNNAIPPSRIDSNAQIILRTFYPSPNFAGAQNFTFNTASFTRYREELIRADHYFSPNWIWTARYAQDSWMQDQSVLRPSSTTLPTIPGLFLKPGKNLVSKLTTVISPTAINLFTFGYSENKITSTPRGGQKPAGFNVPEAFPSNQYNAVPDIVLSNGYAGIGIGSPLRNSNPLFTFKDDFSWTRGGHTIKAGTEILYHRKNEINYANEQGTFNFNGGVTGYSVSDFLIGRAFTYTENGTDIGAETEASDTEFYVQDDWKASTSLTLNMGVRGYLVHGGNGGAAVANDISAFVPGLFDPAKAPPITAAGTLAPETGDALNGIITPGNTKGLDLGRGLKQNNTAWGPRFGFAWAPGSHNTVVRGGYGINYFWGTDADYGLRVNPPFTQSVSIQNTLFSNPLGGPNRIFPPSVTSPDVFNRLPSVQSWSLNVQREIIRNTSLEIGYVGTRSNHLPRTLQLNQAFPNFPATLNANLRRPYPGYGPISYNENSAVSK
ncbi:MAG: carboxypeptidase regulatory-like domain-containing protein [Bryobacteraceae bacterium]